MRHPFPSNLPAIMVAAALLVVIVVIATRGRPGPQLGEREQASTEPEAAPPPLTAPPPQTAAPPQRHARARANSPSDYEISQAIARERATRFEWESARRQAEAAERTNPGQRWTVQGLRARERELQEEWREADAALNRLLGRSVPRDGQLIKDAPVRSAPMASTPPPETGSPAPRPSPGGTIRRGQPGRTQRPPQHANTPAPATASAATRLDELVGSFRSANGAVAAPERATEGTPEVVTLVLSPSGTGAHAMALAREAAPRSTPQPLEAKYHELMEAQLTGDGFDIVARTPQRQAVPSVEPTRWEWTVTPVKAGTQPLHIALSAVVEAGGDHAPRLVRTFQRTVSVSVRAVPPGERIRQFAGNHWEWLLGALGTGITGVWRAAVWWRRTRATQAPPAPRAPAAGGFE